MVSILWDQSSIYVRKNKIVLGPGECCCCETVCPTPSYYGLECEEGNLAHARCALTGCWQDFDLAECVSSIPSTLESQGYTVYISGEDCCNCDGFLYHSVYGCCYGSIDTSSEYDILIPANSGNECELCEGLSIISLENISGEYYWRIPKCLPVYYCIAEY